MEECYLVYQHINKINGKQYVGITKRKPEECWGLNGQKYSTSPKFYTAIQKYGWDNFEHNILETNLTKDEACEKEQYYIKKFNSLSPNGYNLTTGGEMTIMSEEARQKLSNSMKNNTNGAHPCSEETKEKIRLALKGKKFTEEHKQHISEAKRGKSTGSCSEEKRQHIIAAKKDKKPVYCVELNIVYESIQEYARQLNLYATNISKVCKGQRLKTTGGYHFQYATEEQIHILLNA